ncbi:MAG: YafY family transcriptional regulator [Anaerolineales bacterium]|nr:YafY family transcriptional regulator [Anaerolineales bacterium]
MNRIDRLMGYLLMLQSRNLMRAQDFAQQFEISERTVYRDIQALCEVGVPISALPGEGYRLMAGYYLPPIMFSPAEARALFLAVAMLDGFTEDGATKTAVSTALEKIHAVLPQTTRQQVEALQAILHFYAFPAPLLNFDDNTFVRLQEAIHRHRVVRLRYHAQHSNRVTEREVEPTNLVFLDKAWMLTGFCRLRQDERVFRLDRIDQMHVTANTFVPRQLPERNRTRGEYMVTVHFTPTISRWVQEQQHFSHVSSTQLEDGTIESVYRPRSLEQMTGWLLSWGGDMEVIAPSELRQQLAETAVLIAQRHQAAVQMPAASANYAA